MCEFVCPHCGAALNVPIEFAGKRGTCNYCNKAIMIPEPDAPPMAERRGAQEKGQPRQEDKKSSGPSPETWIFILVGIMIVLFFGYLAYTGLSPDSSVNENYGLAASGDGAKFAAIPKTDLELRSWDWETQGSQVLVSGIVRNLSRKTITDLLVVVLLYNEKKEIVSVASEPLDANPFRHNRVCPFRIFVDAHGASISEVGFDFRILDGDALSWQYANASK